MGPVVAGGPEGHHGAFATRVVGGVLNQHDEGPDHEPDR